MQGKALGVGRGEGVRKGRSHWLCSVFSAASAALLGTVATPAHAQSEPALPTDGTFVAGAGTIGSAASGTLTVSQTTARAIIDWKGFSIGAGGTVFIDNGAGATLNRVTGGDLSRINGTLKSSGSVYLINQNGIVIGPEGRVFTGGSFVASTRDISNNAFMAGGAMIASGSGGGSVSNSGAVLAREGDVMLIGRSVDNAGNIFAPGGTASLLAADSVLLATVGGPAGIYVSPDAAASGNVTNTGRIEAAAAALKAARGDVYTLAGNRTGLINATGTQQINGEIWLSAPQGSVVTGGTLKAANADNSGGRITVNGANVVVDATARLDATGSKGGSILLGTSAPGGVDLAGSLSLADGASIKVGGAAGGGLVETSGKHVEIGALSIDAGKGGSWLVDPVDLTINTAAASTIASSLNAGTNVTQFTDATSASGAGVQSPGNGDIVVAAPIQWTGTGTLTLNAFADLKINALVSGNGGFVGTAGGAVNVTANVSASNVALTATGGNLTLGSGVAVTGASGVTLATSAHFVNNAGASALNGGSGRWLVYSSNPVGDTTGGLTPDFYQYAANIGATPATSGNGLLYALAPTLGVSLSGGVAKTYDGTTAATFSNANAPVTGLVNGDTALVTGTYASKNAGTGIAVTASSIAVNHNGIAVYGYAGATPSVSANIGQIDRATLSAAIIGDPTKTYNGTTTATLTSANYQLTGFAAGEGATVNQPSSIAYDSADAGARTLNATFSATNFVAGASTDFANYILPTSATGSGHILQAPLLISGVLALDKVYDQSITALLNTSGASLYGIIGGDDVSLVTSAALGAFATANAGNNLSVSTSGFALSGTRAANYQLVQPSNLTASITPRSLILSGVSANSKIYDATTTATLNTGSASLAGILSGDNVLLNAAGASGTFATADAGTGIAVAASGFGLTGTAAGNYQLAQPTGLFADINRRALSASITGNPTKTYNGDASSVLNPANLLLTGFAGSDAATVDQISQASYASANAGTQFITANLAVSDYVALAGTKLSNYILPTSVSGMGTIAQAPITIAIDGNPSKSYDGNVSAALTGANFRLSGFLVGQGATVNSVLGSYDGPNVGVHGITVTLGAGDLSAVGGTLLSNYAFPSVVTGFGSITPAALGAGIYASVTGNPTKTYDGNTNAILNASNFLLTGFAAGEGATVTETHGTYADKNVGTQVVSVNLDAGDFSANAGTDLSNYTLPTFAFGTGTINPATLTAMIIGSPTKVYNGTNVATVTSGNFSVAGLAPGESINILGATQSSYDSIHAGNRTITAQIATTDVTAGAGTLLSNYVLPTTASGAGLITQAPLAILGLSVADKTYDATTAATLQLGGAHLYGIVGSDDVSLVTGSAGAQFNSANAGASVGVTASGFAISGGAVSDYQLFQPTGLAAAINRAALSVTNVTAQNKVYDGLATATLNLGSAGLSGILAADAGNVALDTSGVSASATSVNVGNGLAVIANGFGLSGIQAGNYALSQPTGLTIDITPRPLTANIVGNPTKVYDGSTSTTLTAVNYDLVGFVAGQGATVPQSAAVNYVDPNAGSRAINSTLVSSDFVANSGTNLSNYILPTNAAGIGTITPAQLTATIVGNPTKTYDTTAAATLTSVNYLLTGFVGGQGATVTETAGLYGSANAGGRAVTATLDGGDFAANGGTNLANYILPISATGTGTINRALLNVVNVFANNKVYDGNVAATLNSGSATLSGVLGSDTVALGTGGASGFFASRNAGTGIGVTATGFSISGAASSNYTLVQPSGLIADITQKSISLTDVRRVYNANSDVAGSSYTLGGLIAGDTVTVNSGGIAGNFADKNVGSGKNVTLTGVALSGAQAGNYTIASSVTNAAIGTITPAALTAGGIVANNKVYDGNTIATLNNAGAALIGLLGSDNVTLQTGSATGTFNNKNAGSNKTVTLTGYAVAGTDAANYTFTQPASVLANITQFTGLSLVSVTKTYDGNTSLPTTNGAYALNGVVGSDVVQVNASGLSGSYAGKNVGNGLSVSINGLALTGADAANYSIGASVTNALIGIINPRSLTAAIIGTPTKTYDSTTAATLTSGNYSLSGFVAGEGATVTETSGLYSSADAGGRTVSATLDSGDFAANGGTLLSNYLLPTSATGAGQINKAPLTIAGVIANNKIYDGNRSAILNTGGATLSGVFASDLGGVTLGTGGASGLFASPDAGTGIAVTASGFTIGGTRSSNYTLAQPTGLLADINRALLTLTSVTKVYDATNSAVGAGVSYTLGGVVGGDTVQLDTSGLGGTYAGKNVGTGLSVSMSGLALTGADATNYSIGSSVTNALIGKITPATLTISGMVAQGKIYDGGNLATINNSATILGGVLGSDIVGFSATPGTGAFASSNVGTWAVTLGGSYAITGADAGNYVLTQPTGLTAAITPAQLAVSIVGNPTKIYDAGSAATLTSGNYSLTGFVAGQGATINQTVGSYDSADAGGRTVTATLSAGNFAAGGGTLLSNYILPTTATGAGTIDQRALAVSIIGTPTKTYDGTHAATLTSGNYSLTGFVAGQGATIGETAGTYDSANAGGRTITALLDGGDFAAAGGTNLANYILPTNATGAGLIDPKALAVAITGNPTKTYDATNSATLGSGDYTLTGFIAGEGAAVTQTAGLYASADAGSWGVTATLGGGDFAANGGTLLSNYVLPTTAAGIGTIDPRALAVAIIGTPTKTYDGTNAATLGSGNYSLTGFVAGQSATIGQTAGTYDSVNAGGRTVTASLSTGDFAAAGGTNLANYILPTNATGLGLIDPKALAVAITGNPTKTYDATNSATLGSSDYTLTGFIAGEGATVTQTTGAYASSDAGSWGVTATLGGGDFAANGGTLLSNYVLPTTAAGIGTIDPRALAVAIIGTPTKTYDGLNVATLTSGNYSLTGFVTGQGATIGQTAGTYDSANAGGRTVTASLSAGDFAAAGGTNLANYILPTSATGAGLIDPKALAVAITGTPAKTYDGTNAATLTSGDYALSGFIAGEGATVTQTAGLYDSANAGNRSVTATLGSGDFAASGGTLLSNYILPTSATGLGLIDPKALAIAITGNPTKTYDATTSATLGSGDYTLTGFIAGEGATVTQTTGAYASADAGSWAVTASLGGGDFAASGGTLLSNYVLPTTAAGIGTIDPRALAVAIIGTPTKAYDGTNAATLGSGNYSLTGFVAGQSATIGQTAGAYDSVNAGGRTVTASLSAGDFAAAGGTNLANYILPTNATGAGLIDPKALTVAITGNPTKTYDATNSATLGSGDYTLTGFIAGEGATVTQTTGAYASSDAGSWGVTATLGGGDFAANGGTLLSNYVLPTTAAGIGTIDPRALAVAIVGTPTKTYDGTNAATLGSGNYSLTGFVAGQGATIGQTAGTYDSANAGGRTVMASLSAGDFAAAGGTNLANYILPTSAMGAGLIDPKALAVAITGTPAKTYDGTNAATLTSGDYALSGFIAGEGAAVTQTAGLYDSANAGNRSVTATLGSGDFSANGGTLLSNYVLPTSATGAGLIDPRALTVAITGNPTKAYDATTSATLGSGDYTLSGFIAGEGATVTQTTGAYASADAGSWGVTATLGGGDFAANGGTLLSNYVLPTTAAGTGTIDPRALAVAIIGTPTKTYDGLNAATLTSGNYSLSGFVAGQGATIDQTAGTYDTVNAGGRTVTASLSAGDFAAAGGTNLANYILPTSATGAGLIDPKALAVAITGTPAKTYDGTNAATLTSGDYALSGFIAGEGATVTQTAGLYDSANAGNRSVTATLGSGDFAASGGTLLSNYILPTSATGLGLIDPKALAIAITGNPTKTYDATTSATLGSGDYTLAGFIAGEGATVTQTTGAYASADAGSWGVTATLGGGDFAANSGTLLSNYVLPTTAAGTGTIDPRALAVAIIGTPTKTYDGTNAATLTSGNYSLTGFVAGQSATVGETAGIYDSANAGGRTVTALLDGGDFAAAGGTNLANYILPTSATGAGLIDPKALAVAITGTPTKTYDGTNAATLTSGDYALSGFIAGEGAAVTQTAGLYDSANAGNRSVTATLGSGDFAASGGTLLSNYVLPTSATGAGLIDPKVLAVAITGTPAKTYDGTNVATLTSGNYNLNGFVAGEGATVTQTAGLYDTANAGNRSVTATLGSGDFAASAGTLLSNYVLPTSATGAGLIDPKALAVAITGTPTKTYDGINTATLTSGDYALGGFIAGEGAAVTQTAGLYDSTNAGSRSVTATLGNGDFAASSGTSLSNYILPTSATGLGLIDPKALTVAITGNPTKTYDATTSATLGAGDYTLSGFIAGEGATVTQTAGLYASSDAGNWGVTATLGGGDFAANGGTLLSNYVLPTTAAGTGTIDPRALAVAIIGTPTKTYDGTNAATLGSGNYSLTGFVTGQGATVTQAAGLYDTANAGNRSVTATLGSGDFAAAGGTNLANYVLPTSAAGAGLIDPRALTAAIIGNPSKTYDGTSGANLNAGNFALTGFIAGQGATVTQTVGAYDSANAGDRTVSAQLGAGNLVAGAGTDLGNYLLPAVATGTGQIDRKALAVAIIGNPTKVADGTTSATLSANNFALQGFVAGEGATVTQTAGSYDAADPGSRTITAGLGAGDFAAASGTLLSNYALPASAVGAGSILPAIETNARSLDEAIIANLLISGEATPGEAAAAAQRVVLGFTMPRAYIPYPAPSALSTWQNNGFAMLPSVLRSLSAVPDRNGNQLMINTGQALINSTSQILLQGDKEKAWTITLPPISASTPITPPAAN